MIDKSVETVTYEVGNTDLLVEALAPVGVDFDVQDDGSLHLFTPGAHEPFGAMQPGQGVQVHDGEVFIVGSPADA